jgi:hypothetical protein
MDMPYRTPDGLLSWLDTVAAPQGEPFGQTPPAGTGPAAGTTGPGTRRSVT